MKVLLFACLNYCLPSTTVCIQLLFALNYCLPVSTTVCPQLTQFYEDFANFKKNLKDLEVMFKNQCNSAFEEATCVQQSTDLLESFVSLARREQITTRY